MTLVSVIIPTHDRVEFVGGAIETVLGQTHEAVEVIVVNDGSTDGTERVLEAYRARDERVRPFHRSVNRGIADGRNHALAHAQGEYVCVLDDDDRWHPEKIERQLAVFEECDGTCGVVYTGGVACRNGRAVGTYSPRADRRGDIYPEILADFGLNPYSSHMIRRSCFERVGTYDTRFPHGEDWDLSIRLAREYEFAAVPEPLVERRFHDANASGERQRTHGSDDSIPRRIEDGTGPYGRIWGKYREEIREHPDLERRYRARRDLACARVELENGHRLKALRHARAALARDPSVGALLVGAFACLGERAISVARRLRNAWIERRLTGPNALPAWSQAPTDPTPRSDPHDRTPERTPLQPSAGTGSTAEPFGGIEEL
jgi:glycosyltransferase involved in cell wall biosynthesis